MKKFTFCVLALVVAFSTFGQQFESEKLNPEDFKNVKVRVGGAYAIQLQSISHELSGSSADTLLDLKNNFNLPTANLTLRVDLAPGIQLFINNYMSSRHHQEAWVEGGYLTFDHLPFLPSTENLMKYLTIKVGVMNPNYGDAHFFRSTNGSVKNNPFVGNFIMDNYTTNPGMEFMYRNKGILALVGLNNGRLNYGRGNDIGEDLVYNWKLGYDSQINDDLRIRGTVSGYHVGEGHSGSYLWDGDRAGARYYNVMQMHDASDNFRSGRWSPGSGQTEMNSYMFNVFAKFKGLEIFTVVEDMKGVKEGADQHFSQTAIQGIYRIGSFYFGGRYNKVSDNEDDESTVKRLNIGGGWDMTKNIVVKLDYVTQDYEGPAHGKIDGGKFDGLVVEAAISF
ncbi:MULTISPECIES: hypothetical protein [unclassified Saccharicrinis]|uniref:hypothetical protein n=1 Tax=unclassified Saccharicrinis TaxID=2646859 RepID=UPI003D330ABE